MSATPDFSNAPFSRENIFVVYGFESNGMTDPAQIAQAALENGKLLKCPVLAEDAAMAVSVFSQSYPDLIPSGVVSLSQLKEEIEMLEAFAFERMQSAAQG